MTYLVVCPVPVLVLSDGKNFDDDDKHEEPQREFDEDAYLAGKLPILGGPEMDLPGKGWEPT